MPRPDADPPPKVAPSPAERAGFRLERSLGCILGAARQRRFLSYGELAWANGLDWAAARRPINAHLWDLIVWGDRNGFPILSAIVVNKMHLLTGRMEPETLKGFVAAARRLGRYDGSEPAVFLRAQQQALFDHVRDGPGG
ncbi:hypothetical protein [Rubellimicrobium roseum]|uniref:Uncharacterized protein n=1 Tax=Rubellimicrobium roseum TaxID=687525 RepID=A0A5C4NPN6_9RHOB|nr:hypothetical protein [Rubellimicrobium roseum]TNC74597.1 hypothetical protein FHG71_00180 [Rubellimicrobium roseum]